MRKTSVINLRVYRSAIVSRSVSSRRIPRTHHVCQSRHRSHRYHRVQNAHQGQNRGCLDRTAAFDAAGVHRNRYGHVRGSRRSRRNATGLQRGHQGWMHGDRGRSIGTRCRRGVQQVARKYKERDLKYRHK